MTGLKLIGAALIASFGAHHWGEPRSPLLIDAGKRASVSATPALPERPRSGHGIAPSEHPEVVRVVCFTGTGTAFRISPTLLLSVAHVTKQKGCGIGKNLITQISEEGDFSVVSDGAKGQPWLTVDCGGFVKGRQYVAVGYARGLTTITEVELAAEGTSSGGFAVLRGVFTVVPGQSGGPVLDKETRRPVGTVNAYDPFKGYSAATALKDTTICKGSA